MHMPLPAIVWAAQEGRPGRWGMEPSMSGSDAAKHGLAQTACQRLLI